MAHYAINLFLMQSCAQVRIWRTILNIAACFFLQTNRNWSSKDIKKRFNSGQVHLENQSGQ